MGVALVKGFFMADLSGWGAAIATPDGANDRLLFFLDCVGWALKSWAYASGS
jgi:hypothetical protein